MKKWSLQYCHNKSNSEISSCEAPTKEVAIDIFNQRFAKVLNLDETGYFKMFDRTWVVCEEFNSFD